jgi:AAA+ ATPase superfamily predicted ATPase
MANILMEVIVQLFGEKTPCQKSSGGDTHHHDDEEEEDHDNLVLESVSDLVGVLAKTMGEQIVPLFDQLQKALNKFLKPSRPYSDRAMAIGVYAEVVAEIDASALKYADVVLKVVKAGLQDSMESVRRNSAYCLGVLVESTGQSLAPHFLEILQALHPLCVRPADRLEVDTGGADIDNALSSVARIIRAGGSAIPLAHVLPVMLNALPLRADPSEGPNIYGCLIDLVQAAEPTAISMLPQIVAAMGETLREESTAVKEVKIRVASFLKHMATNPAMQPNLIVAVQQLPEGEIKQLVQQAIA